MINYNERAKMMSIAKRSINSKYKLKDNEKVYVLLSLLKSLIKYKANQI
ncbi:MAG: hypothetical protein K8Q99_04370 [Acholeplasmataceae bacterium]|nr:hypothetical protein [Acholeplasmataceae bacterium]